MKLPPFLTSRKFWALIGSLAAIWTGFYAGTLPLTEAINLTVAAFAAYSIGTGISDIRSK